MEEQPPSPCQVRDALGRSRVSQGVGVAVMKQSGGPLTEITVGNDGDGFGHHYDSSKEA